MKRKLLGWASIVGSIVAVVIGAVIFMGQGAGYIGVGTVAQQVFSSQTTATAGAIVKNVGQSAHWLQYCTTSVTLIDIRLEGSFDATTWFPITPDARNVKNGTCQVVEAGGYYPNVRTNLIAITGGGASVNAYYYGAVSPISGSGSGAVVNRSFLAQTGLEANSITLGSSFSASVATVNPTTTNPLLTLFNASAGSGTKTAFLDRVIVSCTATCSFSVYNISNTGSGCTAVTPNNLNGGSSITSVLTVVHSSCTGDPTQLTPIANLVNLAANQSFVLDLKGVTIPSAGQGLEVTIPSGLTGTASVMGFWYEQ